eukprot:gene12679-8656_t
MALVPINPDQWNLVEGQISELIPDGESTVVTVRYSDPPGSPPNSVDVALFRSGTSLWLQREGTNEPQPWSRFAGYISGMLFARDEAIQRQFALMAGQLGNLEVASQTLYNQAVQQDALTQGIRSELSGVQASHSELRQIHEQETRALKGAIEATKWSTAEAASDLQNAMVIMRRQMQEEVSALREEFARERKAFLTAIQSEREDTAHKFALLRSSVTADNKEELIRMERLLKQRVADEKREELARYERLLKRTGEDFHSLKDSHTAFSADIQKKIDSMQKTVDDALRQSEAMVAAQKDLQEAVAAAQQEGSQDVYTQLLERLSTMRGENASVKTDMDSVRKDLTDISFRVTAGLHNINKRFDDNKGVAGMMEDRVTRPAGGGAYVRSEIKFNAMDTSTWFPNFTGLHPLLVELYLKQELFPDGMPRDELTNSKFAALVHWVHTSMEKEVLEDSDHSMGSWLMMGLYHAAHRHEIKGTEKAFYAARANISNGMDGFKEYVDAMPSKGETTVLLFFYIDGKLNPADPLSRNFGEEEGLVIRETPELNIPELRCTFCPIAEKDESTFPQKFHKMNWYVLACDYIACK